MTEWRPVPDFAGLYEVSDEGAIRNMRGTLIQPSIDRDGRQRARLRRAGRKLTVKVHRAVARAFHGEPAPGQVVRHRDGNAGHSAATNLHWGTRAQNAQDAIDHGTHPQVTKTHCPQQHEYTPENTYTDPRGARRCKTCRRLSHRTA